MPEQMTEATLAGDTRQAVQQTYDSGGGQPYDEVRWTDPRGRLLSEHDIVLFQQMLPNDLAGKHILELGAGTGRFTLPMLERGYALTATDINEPMVNTLRKKVADLGAADRCTVQIEDIFKLSFPDASFDFAVCLHVIPRFLTLDDQRAALIEIARVLKPGGRFLFNYRNSRSLYARVHKGHAASPTEIEKILSDVGMKPILKRGKRLLNRRVINAMPLFAGRMLARWDRRLWDVNPDRAWDAFLIAQKS